MSLDEFRDLSEKDLEDFKYSFEEYDPRCPVGADLGSEDTKTFIKAREERAHKTRGPIRWLVDNLMHREMIKLPSEVAEQVGAAYARRVNMEKLLGAREEDDKEIVIEINKRPAILEALGFTR
jgi:hypothetical protein